MLTPIATQRLPALWDRMTSKRLVQIGEIQPVFFKIGAALRFVPNDLHDLFVATICFAVKL
jgi:hypothetical protein